jgi:glycosyltransferase involved in cell wall biosynthesis
MSSLRILHVVPYFEGAWAYGGIPRLATALVHGLARRGHQVTVCTTDAGDDRSRWRHQNADAPRNVDLRVFPNISNRLAYDWQMFLPVGLFSFLRRHAPAFDVAHLHACRNVPGLVAAHWLRRAGVPYVLSPNGTAPLLERRYTAKRVFDALGGRAVLEQADAIVAVTEAERRQLVDLGLAEERIRVVPNPVDETEFGGSVDAVRFRRWYGLADAPVVLFLGKLTPRKGVEHLVHAFSMLGTSGARLVIAGNDMGSGAAIDVAISTHGVGDRVVRTGLLRGRDRVHAVAAANVLVYPSRDEIFGLVPLEALMAGTPVVVCNDSGCGEVIGQIGGGHVVPYADPITLAGAIDAILGSPSLWKERAAAAGQRARSLYGVDVVSEQMERVYTGLATRRTDAQSRPR